MSVLAFAQQQKVGKKGVSIPISDIEPPIHFLQCEYADTFTCFLFSKFLMSFCWIHAHSLSSTWFPSTSSISSVTFLHCYRLILHFHCIYSERRRFHFADLGSGCWSGTLFLHIVIVFLLLRGVMGSFEVLPLWNSSCSFGVFCEMGWFLLFLLSILA